MDGTVELGAKIAEEAFIGVDINDMPAEMLNEIINNATPESAFSLSRTGRRYRQVVDQKKNKICEQYLDDDDIKDICTGSNKATHRWCRETSNLCGKVITNFTQLKNLGDTVLTLFPNVYQIPYGVVVIAEGAFKNKQKIRKIIIPDSVTVVGPRAFASCRSLTSVLTPVTPGSVTEIKDGAFYGCESLTSIAILDSVTKIEENVFGGCTSLTSIAIPDSVTEIGREAFTGCTSLTSVTISDSVTEIKAWTFLRCRSLTSVTIPDSVTEIGYAAFEGCTSLTSVTIPDSVENIAYNAFPSHTKIIRKIKKKHGHRESGKGSLPLLPRK